MTNTKTLNARLAEHVVDQIAYRPLSQSAQLDRIYRFDDGVTVRVRVHADSHRDQCWASAEVLTFARDWTHLVTADRDDIAACKAPYAKVDPGVLLAPVADDLARRAVCVLDL